MADQTQIYQVLMNLCTNALHAMENGGGVLDLALGSIQFNRDEVAVYHDLKAGNYLKLTVTDTGHGMDAVTSARIFDPYFTTKDANEGTGLGLAMVHGIVKDHGGMIKVYSEKDSGTAFQIFLPCLDEKSTVADSQPKPLSRGSEQILFLDDDKVLVDIGEQMLQKLGYKVDSRTSPYEALEVFRANPQKYDLVITDMTMPQMSGDAFAQEALKIRSDVPIILCTGFSNLMSPERAEEFGIRGFLMKPLTMVDLSKNIRKVIEQE
jgi:CheY-like chemotaxis protein